MRPKYTTQLEIYAGRTSIGNCPSLPAAIALARVAARTDHVAGCDVVDRYTGEVYWSNIGEGYDNRSSWEQHHGPNRHYWR